VAILLVTLYGFDGKPNSDIEIVLGWAMLILAFPISLIISLAAAGLGVAAYRLRGVAFVVSYWQILISWACFFLAGYWQWFVVLPRFWRRFKSRPAGSP
jgi:hypothetical protein